MKHKLIHTSNRLLVVDDSKVKEGDFVFNRISREVYIFVENYVPYEKKIIAQLPLNNSLILKGVDLLPLSFMPPALVKYKYTEEDLRKAIDMAQEQERVKYTEDYRHTFNANEIIQSLSQPMMPTHFQIDTKVNCDGNNNNGCFLDSCGHYCGCVTPKTITNSQGQTLWVGKYIFPE